MTPTTENRAELRLYIEDLDTPPLFTDTELDTILTASTSVNAAAARLWVMKAARLQKQIGIYGRVQAGQETYEAQDLSKLLAFCKGQAASYAEMDKDEEGSGSSLMISFTPPEIL